jgi:hypothetical protein
MPIARRDLWRAPSGVVEAEATAIDVLRFGGVRFVARHHLRVSFGGVSASVRISIAHTGCSSSSGRTLSLGRDIRGTGPLKAVAG